MAETPPPRRLPRRDYIILPLIALLTILVLGGAAEVTARSLMPEQWLDSCLVPDATLGARPRPQCSSRTKSPEGDWVENRYNECGYRSASPCAAVAPGVARIAVIGSSVSWGYKIPYEQTWYARSAAALSQGCGVPIDVQNLGGVFTLAMVASRAHEAVALKPAVITMVIAPFDLEQIGAEKFEPAQPVAAATSVAPGGFSYLQYLKLKLTTARAVTAAKHLLFRQPASYVPLYLRYGDKADFLRQPFSPAWQQRIAYLDSAIAYLQGQFHDAGIPFVLVFSPQQAQADIVSGRMTIPGVDPFALGKAVGEIARRHQVIFRDVTPEFAAIPDAPDYYLNVDGHMNGNGQRLIANQVIDALGTAREIPAFANCKAPAKP